MRKTILYIALLAVLGTGVWYFLFSSRSDVFGSQEAGFTIRDTGAIGKIYLHGNAGADITLERTDSGWMVNRTYPVLRSKMQQILLTLYSQEAQYPVPENQHNDVIRALAGSGIKVEIYDRRNRKMRVFYVGGEASKFSGTYMLTDGAKKPYVVQIPGFEGYLTPRYNANIKDWRDRIVFRIAPEHIQKVIVQYVQEPLNSFTIAREGGRISVSVDPALMEGKTLNMRRAEAYLKFFGEVYCEQYLDGIEELDSTLRSMPKRCAVDVTGDNAYHQHAEIYYYPMNRRSKNMLAPKTDFESQFDADRCFAVINKGKDTVIIQNQAFNKIYRKGYEFYAPDPQP